jgi:WD40 repeat protein
VARRALTIGVSAFGNGEDLTFASDMVTELADALGALGYTCTSHPARKLSGAELGAFVARELESAESDIVQVVHVLTHGKSGDGDGTVYALGSDGVVHPSGDIAHWLNTAQNSPNQPLTLFLLDLCHAGSQARHAWQAKLADHRTRAWVIAASAGDQSAFDGRFTQAVINVFRAAANGELDIDPTKAHIPLQVVAPAIRREVNRLASDADAYPQDVTATVIDISADVDPPFFPNPRYAPGNRDLALRASLDPGLVPFLDDLDEGLDARHFVERGRGIGTIGDAPGFDELIGCFAGRETQLKQLAPWLNRIGKGAVGVVTGSPGVGKSALLGVLVCAAHPKLRDRTKNVWDRAAQAPYPIDVFAAIHARQRTVSAIVSSLAAQLQLGEQNDVEGLIDHIRELAVPPVIVVDALDEADDGVAVMDTLLLSLAAARRDGDEPAVRLLVGTRRYTQYSPLLGAANLVVDLDDVPRAVLAKDLDRYVSDLLWVTKYGELGGVRGEFATEVARTLAIPPTEPPERRWGEFLVAGLYTRYFVTAHTEPISEPAEAKQLGARVPRTLPEVLELDLAARPDQPWLRPVLTALACAHGQGMPASVLARAAAGLSTDTTEPPTHTELRSALEAGRFYLRQATDTDHTTLYRLFHQGLADYLISPHGTMVGKVFEHLLDPLGPTKSRDWSAAEPYVVRHAIQHAQDAGRTDELLDDPEFLLAADQTALKVQTNNDRRVTTLPSASSGMPIAERRASLARNATMAGLTTLATRAANPPGQQPLSWQPVWAGSLPPDPVPASTLAPKSQPRSNAGFRSGRFRYGDSGPVSAIAHCVIDGNPVAVIATGRSLRLIDLRSRQPLNELTTWYHTSIQDVACANVRGRPVALTVGRYYVDHRVVLWDLLERKGNVIRAFSKWMRAVACGTLANRSIAVVAAGRDLDILDLARGDRVGTLVGHTKRITAVACTTVNGRSIAVSGSASWGVRVWDLETKTQLSAPLTGHAGHITAIACTSVDGQAVALTASADRTVRMWSLEDLEALGEPWIVGSVPNWLSVQTLADGRTVALTTDPSHGPGVAMWDLNRREPLSSMRYTPGVMAATSVDIDGHAVLVTADGSGQVQLRAVPDPSVRAVPPERASPPGGFGAETGPRSALADARGRRLVLLASVGGSVEARDLETGEPMCSRVQTGSPLAELHHETVAGRSVAVLTPTDRTSRLWDLETGAVIDAGSELVGPHAPDGQCRSVRLVIGDRLVVVRGDDDGRLEVLDPKTHGFAGIVMSGHTGPVTALAAIHYDARLAVENTVRESRAGDVIHQAFAWSHGAGLLSMQANSFPAEPQAELWRRRLQAHIRPQPVYGAMPPAYALSYLDFGDGTAAVVRQINTDRPRRNNLHALIGSAAVLDVPVALALASWEGWLDEIGSLPWPRSLSPADLPNIAEASQMLREQVQNFRAELITVLAQLLDDPAAPLSIIGCPDEYRLTMVWGLYAAVDEYLRRKLGHARRWSFSTHEVSHDAAIERLPEIVFLPDPQIDVVVNRTVVDLDRGRNVSRNEALADRLVASLLSGSQPVFSVSTPVVFSGGADGTVRVRDLVARRQLDRIDVDGPVSSIEVTRDGYLVVIAGDRVITFRHVEAVRGKWRA